MFVPAPSLLLLKTCSTDVLFPINTVPHVPKATRTEPRLCREYYEGKGGPRSECGERCYGRDQEEGQQRRLVVSSGSPVHLFAASSEVVLVPLFFLCPSRRILPSFAILHIPFGIILLCKAVPCLTHDSWRDKQSQSFQGSQAIVATREVYWRPTLCSAVFLTLGDRIKARI